MPRRLNSQGMTNVSGTQGAESSASMWTAERQPVSVHRIPKFQQGASQVPWRWDVPGADLQGALPCV